MPIDDSHPYVPAGPKDSRSPCPALNALANHGYLPHDGRNITHSQLVAALRRVYNLSCPFATILALGGLFLCGHKKPGFTLARVLDLHDLARHNAIEHDGSLVHADIPNPADKFAPAKVDPALLTQLLDVVSDSDAPGDGDEGCLGLEDLCRAQVLRHQPGASRKLDALHASFARGEMALMFEVLGKLPTGPSRVLEKGSVSTGPVNELEVELQPEDHLDSESAKPSDSDSQYVKIEAASGGKVDIDGDEIRVHRHEQGEGQVQELGKKVIPKRFLKQWLGEERLPDGWARPAQVVGYRALHAREQEIGMLENVIRNESLRR